MEFRDNNTVGTCVKNLFHLFWIRTWNTYQPRSIFRNNGHYFTNISHTEWLVFSVDPDPIYGQLRKNRY